MFTQAHSKTPIYFSRNAEAVGGTSLDMTTWPFNVPLTKDLTTPNVVDAGVEHKKQIKVLGPVTSAIAQEFNNGHTLEIINLVQQKSAQVIELANSTEVTISGQKTTILRILADSSMGPGSWSVVGHKSVQAIKDFALGLHLENLRKL